MNVAVVGYGTMGKLLAGHLASMDGVRLSAICSTSPKTKPEAERLGARWYADYADMLASCAGLQAVVLALPTHLHRTFAVLAAKSGLHVFCEKPMALSPAECDEMIDACERSGVVLFVGHVLRFFPEYADLRRHVTEGAIGRIAVAHAKRFGPHPGDTSWFVDEAKSGGVLLDMMIHDIDFIRSIMGEVRTVYAFAYKSPGLQYANATLRFSDGAIANLEAMWGYPGPFTTFAELAGDGGIVRSDSNLARPVRILRSSRERREEGVEIPSSPTLRDPYRRQLEHFIDCVRTGSSPIVSARDARQAVAVACAALESVRTGRPVKLGETPNAGTVSEAGGGAGGGGAA
jgi:predicted dehydrogenase